MNSKNAYYIKTKLFQANEICNLHNAPAFKGGAGHNVNEKKTNTQKKQEIGGEKQQETQQEYPQASPATGAPIPSILGNLLKILFILKPQFSEDGNYPSSSTNESPENLKKKNICFYYLHLIYIKLFMINL